MSTSCIVEPVDVRRLGVSALAGRASAGSATPAVVRDWFQPQAAGVIDRLLRTAVETRMSRLQRGTLTVRDGASVTQYGNAAAGEIDVAIRVNDPRFYRSVALGGSLGAAEAYIDGLWSTDDLLPVIRLMARNQSALEGLDGGLSFVTWPVRKAVNLLKRNTRRGSRKNIAAHYDLSNDFFRLFLDDTMTYSSGIFESPDSTLREASVAKYDRICRKLHITPHDHVVEIGTGWGSFAIHAATNYGCRVTTTTISREQARLARQRVAEAGLQDQIRIVESDYRDLTGQYDKLVSIEMIEAVGHEYLPAYFTKCSQLLKPDGMMALQAITIPDQRYDRYRRTTDFIQRYIFPGGVLPSIGSISRAVRLGTDLQMTHLEDFAPHYARTLSLWRERFFENLDGVRRWGADDRFIRCWEFYLYYCEAGFAERQIGVSQLVFAKPDCRHEPLLGSL